MQKNVEQKLMHTWLPTAQIAIAHYHLDSHAHHMWQQKKNYKQNF